MLTEIRGLNEECGVFGIWGHHDAAQITYYGLHAYNIVDKKEQELSLQMVKSFTVKRRRT